MQNNSKSNRLIDQKSPYLLQHAYNPVDWFAWGQEAFEKATQENKPILLSIGYSTCHWCHVMAHESFEDETIAQIINDNFVAIKVDREERPDLDHIYMTATTAMTGQGGWPLTVFLTPQAKPFYGGTYFPPYAKWGSVGFIDLLKSISFSWVSNPGEVIVSSETITQSLRQQVHKHTSVPLQQSLLDSAFHQMNRNFDSVHGGFGQSPKFPMGHNLSFLLGYYQNSKQEGALKIVEQSLDAMSRGGIRDYLAGGFHRYSTDAKWHIPHFEKMLYDQALLLRAYLEAYQVTGELRYALLAREIADYVLTDMRHADGGFFSAEDADSLDPLSGHTCEGAFYVFSESEIFNQLGDSDGKVFNYCYGVAVEGNAQSDPHGEFIGKNILYEAHDTAEAASFFAMQEYQVQDILERSKVKLLIYRNQRKRPHLDDKILTDWNGLMIAGLGFASRVLGDQSYQVAAEQAANFIVQNLMKGNRLLHRWRDGSAGIEGLLEDYAFFIYALIELYEVSAKEEYLSRAISLTDEMIRLFADQEGGFYMTAIDAPELILRPKDAYDGAIPSGNAVAAMVLLKVSALTSKQEYKKLAQGILNCFQDSMERYPSAHTFLLSALNFDLSQSLSLTIEGQLDDDKIAKVLKVVYKYFMPYKVLQYRFQETPIKMYLCHKGVCLPPLEDITFLESKLQERELR